MLQLYWFIIRPSGEQIQFINIYSAFWDTCTFILTATPIVSFWDPRMHYKCWYIGYLLQKAWWWLNRVEKCCLKCNCIIKLLCLTGICIFYVWHLNWDFVLRALNFLREGPWNRCASLTMNVYQLWTDGDWIMK